MTLRRLGLALVSVLVAAPLHAQESGVIAAPPVFDTQGIYSTKQAVQDDVYSTKPQAPAAPALTPFPAAVEAPEQRPAPVGPPSRYHPGYVPFGRASAEVTAPMPSGPRDVTSAPVGDVGISAQDLPPATEATPVALPPKDPTEPTAQTSAIFEADDDAGSIRKVTLSGLNKVTAQVSRITGAVGTVLRFGNLEIIAKSCRASAKTSQEDYAALLEIQELKAGEAPKELFSGWMYASSPSLMALEHPVYDVTVQGCHKANAPRPVASAKK